MSSQLVSESYLKTWARRMQVVSGTPEIQLRRGPNGTYFDFARDMRRRPAQAQTFFGVPASTMGTMSTHNAVFTGSAAYFSSAPGSSTYSAEAYTVTYTAERYQIDLYANGTWTSSTGTGYVLGMPVHIGQTVPEGTWVVVNKSIVTDYTGIWPKQPDLAIDWTA